MMVNRAVCEDCENQVDYIVRDGPIHCECGQEMEFFGKVGVVMPVSKDIRPEALELAGDLRQRAFDDGSGQYAEGLCEAADEIEELAEPDGMYATAQEGES